MPSSDREKRVERYRQLSLQADELAHIGKKDEALAILRPAREEAQKAGDEDYRLFLEAEIENYTEPNYDHQIALLQEALQWDEKNSLPSDFFLHGNLGAHYSLKGDEEAAIEWFDKALAINPKDSVAMRLRGVSLSKKGEEDAAIEWFDKALAINPNDCRAARHRGVSIGRKGDWGAAIEWFDKTLTINSKDFTAMENRGVALAKKGNLDAANEWLDKSLAVNPENSSAMSNRALVFWAMGKKHEAQEWIGKAILQDRVKHWDSFSFLCRRLRLDPDKEYQSLKEKSAKGKGERKDAEPLPKETREKGEVGEMQAFIQFLRDGLKSKAEEYIQLRDEAEAKRQSFLKEESRLDPNRSILMVLRRWNSYTPGIPSSEDERSRGGGYFLWHRGKGIVIDPGYDFLENLNAAGVRLTDVDCVVVTHAHNDHTMDFETLRTLLYEYNDNEKTKRKKKVHFYLNNGAFMKFAGLIDLRDEDITGSIQTMNPGNRFVLDRGIEMQVLPAYHDEVISRTHAVGLKFAARSEEGKPWRLLFTGDTGLYPLHSVGGRNRPDPKGDEVWKHYGLSDKQPIDVLVVHIGSIKEEELQKRSPLEPGEACYPNHLGIIGTARVITSCRPNLAVVSEFGEEMRDFREPLVRDLPRRVVTPYMQAKMPGVEPPEIVPGDLPFVYDLAEKKFYCCISRKWVDFRRIGFFEMAREKREKVVYFYDRKKRLAEHEKSARAEEFDGHRKKTFDKRLYFKKNAIRL